MRRPALLRPWYHDTGNAAVEFALVLPILMILLAGGVDYAVWANAQMSLQAATRGAAEYARLNPSASATTVAAYGNFPANVTPTVATFCTCTDNSIVSCTASSPCASVVDAGGSSDTRIAKYVQVSATQTFTPWIPYPSFFFPPQLHASTSLRLQ